MIFTAISISIWRHHNASQPSSPAHCITLKCRIAMLGGPSPA
jgi:hypothetical protein